MEDSPISQSEGVAGARLDRVAEAREGRRPGDEYTPNLTLPAPAQVLYRHSRYLYLPVLYSVTFFPDLRSSIHKTLRARVNYLPTYPPAHPQAWLCHLPTYLPTYPRAETY